MSENTKNKRSEQQLIDLFGMPYEGIVQNVPEAIKDNNVEEVEEVIEIEEEDNITEEIEANLKILKETYDITSEEIERTLNDVMWGKRE